MRVAVARVMVTLFGYHLDIEMCADTAEMCVNITVVNTTVVNITIVNITMM